MQIDRIEDGLRLSPGGILQTGEQLHCAQFGIAPVEHFVQIHAVEVLLYLVRAAVKDRDVLLFDYSGEIRAPGLRRRSVPWMRTSCSKRRLTLNCTARAEAELLAVLVTIPVDRNEGAPPAAHGALPGTLSLAAAAGRRRLCWPLRGARGARIACRRPPRRRPCLLFIAPPRPLRRGRLRRTALPACVPWRLGLCHGSVTALPACPRVGARLPRVRAGTGRSSVVIRGLARRARTGVACPGSRWRRRRRSRGRRGRRIRGRGCRPLW